MELIRAWIEDRVGIIALNNYGKRNALSQALIAECLDAFSEFQVGTGHRTTLRRFVEIARDALGSASVLNFGALPYRPGEIMDSVADPKRLNDLGWRHTADLHRGVGKTVAAG